MVTDEKGCTSSDVTVVTVYSETSVTASNSGAVCYDETSITLYDTGGDAESWLWSGGCVSYTNDADQNLTLAGFLDGVTFSHIVTAET